MAAPYRRIGRVLKPHGTHGEVSVALRTGLPSPCLDGLQVWLVPPGPRGARSFTVSSVRQGPKGSLLRFDIDETAAQAGALAGRWMLARVEDLPAEADAPGDLIGMRVEDTVRGLLGQVTDVIVTGANDVLVIEGDAYGQVLVPVIPDVLIGIDEADRTISVRLLDGLIDRETT
jgi:16S rRNA processing protein RimM